MHVFRFWLGHVMWLLNSIFSLKNFQVLTNNNISVDMPTKTKQFLWSFFFICMEDSEVNLES